MIPSTTAFLEQDFEITEQPTHTYKMNLESNLIRGYTDGQEAMKQAIYKILNTERYQYVMYSWNYGIELLDLYGEPVSYVCPVLLLSFLRSHGKQISVWTELRLLCSGSATC